MSLENFLNYSVDSEAINRYLNFLAQHHANLSERLRLALLEVETNNAQIKQLKSQAVPLMLGMSISLEATSTAAIRATVFRSFGACQSVIGYRLWLRQLTYILNREKNYA